MKLNYTDFYVLGKFEPPTMQPPTIETFSTFPFLLQSSATQTTLMKYTHNTLVFRTKRTTQNLNK